MKTITIKGRLINLDKIHFVRRESYSELLISFGTDFLKFTGSQEELEEIFNTIESHAEFSSNRRRSRTMD